MQASYLCDIPPRDLGDVMGAHLNRDGPNIPARSSAQ